MLSVRPNSSLQDPLARSEMEQLELKLVPISYAGIISTGSAYLATEPAQRCLLNKQIQQEIPKELALFHVLIWLTITWFYGKKRAVSLLMHTFLCVWHT